VHRHHRHHEHPGSQAPHGAHHEIEEARAKYHEVSNEEHAEAADEALFKSIDAMK
jgi:hypothetical protein